MTRVSHFESCHGKTRLVILVGQSHKDPQDRTPCLFKTIEKKRAYGILESGKQLQHGLLF